MPFSMQIPYSRLIIFISSSARPYAISIQQLISMSSCLINSAVQLYQMHYWSPCRWHTKYFLEPRLSYPWHQDRPIQFTSGKPMSTFIPFSIYFHVFNYTVLQNTFESLVVDGGQTNSSVTARLISLPCLPALCCWHFICYLPAAWLKSQIL